MNEDFQTRAAEVLKVIGDGIVEIDKAIAAAQIDLKATVKRLESGDKDAFVECLTNQVVLASHEIHRLKLLREADKVMLTAHGLSLKALGDSVGLIQGTVDLANFKDLGGKVS